LTACRAASLPARRSRFETHERMHRRARDDAKRRAATGRFPHLQSTTEGTMFKHILVPTDGSDLSKKAIDGAIDLAQAVGARVTAYACLPQYPYSPFSEVVIEPPVDFQQRSEREAQVHLQEVEQAARSAGVACDCQTSVHPSPYLGIIEAAEQGGCDVIFMASHGRRGLGSLLIGSETQRVLTHTKIPVIVYR
jgi:nucleotide-binding universal stress UspA family protein